MKDLYRGIDLRTKKWVYGVGWSCRPDGSALLLSADDGGCLENAYFCDPDTMGQASGVLDKNKTMMFEGDIVSGLFLHERPVNAVVTFQDGSFGLSWLRGSWTEFAAFPCMCHVEYEIVGNIHENPDMLEGIENA